MSNLEVIKEELDVLKSIYEGDENFEVEEDNSVKYKFIEQNKNKNVTVEFKFNSTYPDTLPDVQLDLFCNNQVSKSTKEAIYKFISDEASNLLGSAMIFTLVEAVKENINNLYQPESEINIENEEEIEISSNQQTSDTTENKNKNKKEQMSKAQKRRLLEKQEKGELPRGWNWVDVIHHLQQTANKN